MDNEKLAERCKQILGFTTVGLEGGELMAVVETATLGKLPYTVLQDAIFCPSHAGRVASLRFL